MTTPFSDADAQRLINVIDERTTRRLNEKSKMLYGVVADVDTTAKYCSAYLDGQSTYASPYFRYPAFFEPRVGDVVRCEITGNGERLIDAVMDTDLALRAPSNLRVDGNLNLGDYPNLNSSKLAQGLLELRGPTPYIDFSNDNSADYDGRLRLTSDDVLAVEGAVLNAVAGAQLNGNDLVYYVPVSQIQVFNGSTTSSNITSQLTEVTSLPSSVVRYVHGHLVASNDNIATASYLDVESYANSAAVGGIAYPIVATKYAGSAFLVDVGGTNNRQLRYSVQVGSGTVTYYVRIIGYWRVI